MTALLLAALACLLMQTDVAMAVGMCDTTSATIKSSCTVSGSSIDIIHFTQQTVTVGNPDEPVTINIVPAGCTYPLLRFENLELSLHAAIRAQPLDPALCDATEVQNVDGAAGGSFWSYGGQGGPGHRPAAPIGSARELFRGGVPGGNNATGQGAGWAGGAARLNVTGTLLLDGQIDVSGTGATANGASGGSGGVVDITCDKFESPNNYGRILALGGAGMGSGGGGSGGIVHLSTASALISPSVPFKPHQVSAFGGYARKSELCGLEPENWELTCHVTDSFSQPASPTLAWPKVGIH